jgi:hypothetical protein
MQRTPHQKLICKLKSSTNELVEYYRSKSKSDHYIKCHAQGSKQIDFWVFHHKKGYSQTLKCEWDLRATNNENGSYS